MMKLDAPKLTRGSIVLEGFDKGSMRALEGSIGVLILLCRMCAWFAGLYLQSSMRQAEGSIRT